MAEAKRQITAEEAERRMLDDEFDEWWKREGKGDEKADRAYSRRIWFAARRHGFETDRRGDE